MAASKARTVFREAFGIAAAGNPKEPQDDAGNVGSNLRAKAVHKTHVFVSVVQRGYPVTLVQRGSPEGELRGGAQAQGGGGCAWRHQSHVGHDAGR